MTDTIKDEVTEEEDIALCFFTEYPCNKPNCNNFIECKEQHKKNYPNWKN